MTIQKKEFDLSVEIWKFLNAEGLRPDDDDCIAGVDELRDFDF